MGQRNTSKLDKKMAQMPWPIYSTYYIFSYTWQMWLLEVFPMTNEKFQAWFKDGSIQYAGAIIKSVESP